MVLSFPLSTPRRPALARPRNPARAARSFPRAARSFVTSCTLSLSPPAASLKPHSSELEAAAGLRDHDRLLELVGELLLARVARQVDAIRARVRDRQVLLAGPCRDVEGERGPRARLRGQAARLRHAQRGPHGAAMPVVHGMHWMDWGLCTMDWGLRPACVWPRQRAAVAK